MAGLLAWAVGKGGQINEDEDEEEEDRIPLIFSPQQQRYARELDQKAGSLSRAIQDLRLRLPPPNLWERLPHLHAHSLASNAALALQLNAHSVTKQQTHSREVQLQEENGAYVEAISECENKMRDKLQEAELLLTKLKEMDLAENNLKAELDNAQVSVDAGQSGKFRDSMSEFKTTAEAQGETRVLLEKLDNKKKELGSVVEMVQKLEKKWAQVQESVLKQPTPAQREKVLDTQLHSLIEQLASKQAQAEGLVNDIHAKEIELEGLNGLCRQLETSTAEMNAARSRFGRSSSQKGLLSSDYIVDPHDKPPYHMCGRVDSLQRQTLLRSAFVLYILALHILVFIRISF